MAIKLENKILDIVSTSDDLSVNSVIKRLTDTFSNEFLSEKDKMLLELTFSKNPTQKDLDEFLKKWDIEATGSNKSLMLAYFMKLHPQLKFTNYELPRLNGLLKFFRFANLEIISHFTKVGKALNKENIPILIIKGGVMRYLRPEFPRTMSDIDIIVPAEDYERTKKIITDLGYDYQDCGHSIDLHPKDSEVGTVDIHKFIEMNTGFEETIIEDMFNRAKKKKVFSVDAYVPAFEDLLFLSLVNIAKNLREKSSTHSVMLAFYDCNYFLKTKPDFNWEIFIEDVTKTKTEAQIGFMVKFMNSIVSDILPKDISEDIMLEKSIQDYCKETTFERYIFPPIQEHNRAMKIQDAIKSPKKLIGYIKDKPRYLLLKKIRKHPKFIRFVYDLWIKHLNKNIKR